MSTNRLSTQDSASGNKKLSPSSKAEIDQALKEIITCHPLSYCMVQQVM